MNINQAMTSANINRRAQTLFAQGYKMEAAEDPFTGVFYVVKPTGEFYTVVPDGKGFCTCPAHQRYDECKHLIAVQNALKEAAQIARFEEEDALIANGESRFGCDPMRF